MRTRVRSVALAASLLVSVPVFSPRSAEAGSYQFRSIAEFDGMGGPPVGNLGIDAAGNIYGVARSRLLDHHGTVFKLDTGSSTPRAVAIFDDAAGGSPAAGVAVDAAGNVYGATTGFGTGGKGTVYKIDAATGALSKPVVFDGVNGAYPEAGVAVDAAGNIYGSSRGGVFKIEGATGALTTLAPGVNSSVAVAVDAAGNLFGATAGDGKTSFGSLFKIDAGTDALHTLATLKGNAGAGVGPNGDLALDAAGNLYFATGHSSPYDDIGVFKYDAVTGAVTNLALFGGRTNIIGGPVVDAAGNVYGISFPYDQGYGGEVFKIDAQTGVLSTIHSFDEVLGTYPYSGLTIDAAGNLYGTWTMEGRTYIFELSPVPEPASLAMLALGAGVVGVAAVRRKRSPGA